MLQSVEQYLSIGFDDVLSHIKENETEENVMNVICFFQSIKRLEIMPYRKKNKVAHV